MKSIALQVNIPDRRPDDVYRALRDFASYPALCAAVRSVHVESSGHDETVSNWEVNFQNGVLKWRERDRFDSELLKITFEQISGDIDHFAGCWSVYSSANGSTIVFDADFDLGIPMLADMLDPVAKQAIEDNIHSIIQGLFLTTRVAVA